jgi:hypothetical protein
VIVTFFITKEISIHGYVVENWRKVLLLLNLQKVIEGGESNNLTAMLVNFVHTFGDFLMGV